MKEIYLQFFESTVTGINVIKDIYLFKKCLDYYAYSNKHHNYQPFLIIFRFRFCF